MRRKYLIRDNNGLYVSYILITNKASFSYILSFMHYTLRLVSYLPLWNVMIILIILSKFSESFLVKPPDRKQSIVLHSGLNGTTMRQHSD